jgi:hypothetical protein
MVVSVRTAAVVLALSCAPFACGAGGPAKPASPAKKPVASAKPPADDAPLPPHLQQFPGLFVRKGNEIVDAPPADIAVAKSYPRSTAKGAIIDGHRLTLLTAKQKYRVGEEIRVIHVHEVPIEGDPVYPMGPKPVRGEHVNGKLVTPDVVADVDPFIPEIYNGAVVPSPAVDYNWDITTYRFSAPGVRTIQWKLGRFMSNPLRIEIVP